MAEQQAGPPEPYNPTPTDHLNFANSTREYRKDRTVRALGFQGVPTGMPNRPLYGIGQATEDIIAAARGSSRPRNPLTGEAVQKRPEMQTGKDGSVALKRPNLPDSPMKQAEVPGGPSLTA